MASPKNEPEEPHLKEQDEDNPQLSSHTLSLLQEFYAERDAQQKLLASLDVEEPSDSPKDVSGSGPLDMSFFEEDWNASQFWYTNSTADTLASALTSSSESVNVAVISAPSVFAGLKRLLHNSKNSKINLCKLLEYDSRFSAWPEFTHYDYNSPTKLDPSLRGQFDRIILDPPFLSEDCQTKAALTARWLAKSWTLDLKIIICTGERMASLIEKLYSKVGVRMTDFQVQHARGLGNEFRCYANFEVPGTWKFVTN